MIQLVSQFNIALSQAIFNESCNLQVRQESQQIT
jgi:hypothetical protein